MNRLFFVLLFIGSFYSYANSFCQGVWNSNPDLKEKKQLSPEIVKQIFGHFYRKMEDIVPDINITELKISQEIFIPGDLKRNEYSLVPGGIEITTFEILREPANAVLADAFNRMFDHLNNQDYLIGKWHGKKVFLKKIQRSQGEDELAVMRTLNKIGIPVLFKGVVKNKDGTLYMVSLFLDSPLFKSEEAALQYFSIQYHEKIRQQLQQIHSLYSRYGILPRDFQFMVSRKGVVYVVDGEFYMFLGGEVEKKKDKKPESGKRGTVLDVVKRLKFF